jgi:hypothetical protein
LLLSIGCAALLGACIEQPGDRVLEDDALPDLGAPTVDAPPVVTADATIDLAATADLAATIDLTAAPDLTDATAAGTELPSALATVSATPKSLQARLNAAQPGDHIICADGVYAGDYTLSNSGTAAHPIVVRAANPQKAELTGKLTFAGDHGWAYRLTFRDQGQALVIDGDFVTVKRCLFRDQSAAVAGWILWRKGRDGLLTHCEFDHQGGIAVMTKINAYGTRRLTVRRSYFHDPVALAQNTGEAIGFGQARADTDIAFGGLIEHNLFVGDGQQRWSEGEIVGLKSSDNVVRYNTFKDAKNGVLSFRHGERNQAIANRHVNTAGFKINDVDHTLTGNVGQVRLFEGSRDGDGNPSATETQTQTYSAKRVTVARHRGDVLLGYYRSVKERGFPTTDASIEAQLNGTVSAYNGDGAHVGTKTSAKTKQPDPGPAPTLTPADVGLEAGP